MKASPADHTATQNKRSKRSDALMTYMKQPANDLMEDLIEVTQGEVDALRFIQDQVENEGRTLKQVQDDFDMAMGLHELSISGRPN